MSLSSLQNTAAAEALDDIELERRRALATVLTSWDLFSGTGKAAAENYLKVTAVNAIDSLRRQLDRVDSGAMSWQTWVSNADSVRRGILDVAGYTDEWSLLGVLRSTASATASDVGDTVNDARTGAGLGAAAFVFAALLYVAWKVS